jgi:hypothetical protein
MLFPFLYEKQKKEKRKQPIQLPIELDQPLPQEKPREEKEEPRVIIIELFTSQKCCNHSTSFD